MQIIDQYLINDLQFFEPMKNLIKSLQLANFFLDLFKDV